MHWWSILPLCLFVSAQLGSTTGDNCYTYSGETEKTCICCKSGYGGGNCTEVCTNCESRLLLGNQCMSKCKEGYYGDLCSKVCPTSCAKGSHGSPSCEDMSGSLVCKECDSGRYGDLCRSNCSSLCQGNVCFRDGRCRNCKSNTTFGDVCNMTCSTNCSRGMCKRNGQCSGGCTVGHYGEMCNHTCGENCNYGMCSPHLAENFDCIHGCKSQFWGINCSNSCPPNCIVCHQHSGKCFNCKKDVSQRCEDDKCLSGHMICGDSVVADVNGWFIAFIVCISLAVPAFILLILYIIWTKRRSDELTRSLKNGTYLEAENLVQNTLPQQTDLSVPHTSPNGGNGDQADGRKEYQDQVFSDLHNGCRNGDLETVQRIIKSRPEDINKRGRRRMTPIMEATAKGHTNVTDFLLKSKCDLLLHDINNNTVMHFACDRNNVSLVKDLLKQRKPPGINDRGIMGRTPLFIAARNGYSELFDLLRAEGGEMHATDDDNNTILSVACCNDTNKDFVQKLLKLKEPDSHNKGKDKLMFDINAKGYKGRTPLMTAAYKGFFEIFQILWNNDGCDKAVTDDTNDSILNVVCYNDNEDVMRYLLSFSLDINVKGCKGRTPVMIAARNGCIKVFHLLVENNCDLALRDKYGDTVLHHACCTNNVEIVKYLLRKKIFHIEFRGQEGRTPVLVAALNGCTEVVQFLLCEGCDVTVKDNNNDTIQSISHGNMTRYFSSQNTLTEIAKA